MNFDSPKLSNQTSNNSDPLWLVQDAVNYPAVLCTRYSTCQGHPVQWHEVTSLTLGWRPHQFDNVNILSQQQELCYSYGICSTIIQADWSCRLGFPIVKADSKQTLEEAVPFIVRMLTDLNKLSCLIKISASLGSMDSIVEAVQDTPEPWILANYLFSINRQNGREGSTFYMKGTACMCYELEALPRQRGVSAGVGTYLKSKMYEMSHWGQAMEVVSGTALKSIHGLCARQTMSRTHAHWTAQLRCLKSDVYVAEVLEIKCSLCLTPGIESDLSSQRRTQFDSCMFN